MNKIEEGNDKTLTLPCPVAGRVTSLEQHPNPLIRHQLFGSGITIEPKGFHFTSPFAGRVEQFPEHCEYLRITSQQGLKLHIQIASELDKLMGQGIQAEVAVKDKIVPEQRLFTFDNLKLRRIIQNPVFAICLLNSRKISKIEPHFGEIQPNEPMFTLHL